MRLKSIKLFGFKSFADRIEVDVDDNLVAVVGPNGCGKSNLVDAVMWALGEASPRNLRAETSADIIFSGSAKRRALGYAEVTLTFDNESGILPVATSEVTVGRRVDRKGGSDFYINGRACRLRDIYELFADSGLGRTGYAIVSQNEIDAALSANPEDRRTWLDEAAGVQRYRTRKIEALKRLESAIEHLQRVNDVIAEIETQREPLEKEAVAAKAYKEKLGALREVESGLLILEAARYREAITRLTSSVAEKHQSAAKMRAEADGLDAQSRTLRKKAEELDEKIEEIAQRVQRAITNLERAESKKAIALQRIKSLEEFDENREKERESADSRIERAAKLLDGARRELAESEQAIKMLIQVIAGSEKEAASLNKRLAEAERKLVEARTGQIRQIEMIAKAAHLEERRKHLERELEGAKQALPSLKAESERAEKQVRTIQHAIDSARKKRDALESSHAEAHRKLSQVDEKRRAALGELAKLEGQIQALRSNLESFSGLPYGVRSVLEAVQQKTVQGDFQTVGSALQVPSEFAAAIEAALGSAASYLLCSHSRDAKAAIEFLKREGAGRATFLASDLIAARPRSKEIEALAKLEGVVGIAGDLVKTRSEHAKAIELLLGGVLIVKGSAAAAKLSGRPGYQKIVTVQGDVQDAHGAISGGNSANQAPGQIQTAAMIEKAEKERAALGAHLAKLEAQAKEIASDEAEHAARVVSLLAELNESEKELADTVQWHSSIKHELIATEKTIRHLSQEIAAIDSASKQAAKGDDNASDEVQKREKERNELLAFAASQSADVQQSRKALQETEERLEAARERLRHAEAEHAEAVRAKSSRETRSTTLADERKSLEEQIEQAEAEISSARQVHEKEQTLLETAKQERRSSLQESQRMAEEANQLRATAVSVDDAAYQDDIQRARQETRLAASLARLLEEYGTTEEEAMEQAGIVSVPPDAEKLVGQLRRELRALGDVNLGAIEAYERLTERYEILSTQRADILESKAELDRSVEELDKITRGAFKETFEKVRAAFSEIFTKLFGGGEAHLELTQPDRLLDTGVEIHVQVPGKKVQRLEMLSGGERALSACAFLFALFKVKPSPVCILDELDAPLDGRNVERYVELLKDFAKSSQFIVITHNPTTIEAAPIWFGITMQEPGVSIVIPYRTREGGNGKPAAQAENKATVI